MNVRELIDLLNQAAEAAPDGLDSTVLVRLRDGREGSEGLAGDIRIVGDEKGAAAHCVIVEGRPHDDENRGQRPTVVGVDAELTRLRSGDPLPRAGITVAIGDTGDGFRIPYGEGGRPILPGSPEAVAAGCLCDPEANEHGRQALSADHDHVDMVTDEQCQIHRRVPVDAKDDPAVGETR